MIVPGFHRLQLSGWTLPRKQEKAAFCSLHSCISWVRTSTIPWLMQVSTLCPAQHTQGCDWTEGLKQSLTCSLVPWHALVSCADIGRSHKALVKMQKLSRDQAPWIKTLHSRWFSHVLKHCLVFHVPTMFGFLPTHGSVSTAGEYSSTRASLQPAHSFIIGSVAFVHLKLRRSLVQSHLYRRRGFSYVDQGLFSACEIIPCTFPGMWPKMELVDWEISYFDWIPHWRAFLLRSYRELECAHAAQVPVQGEEHLPGPEQGEEHLPGIFLAWTGCSPPGNWSRSFWIWLIPE